MTICDADTGVAIGGRHVVIDSYVYYDRCYDVYIIYAGAYVIHMWFFNLAVSCDDNRRG